MTIQQVRNAGLLALAAALVIGAAGPANAQRRGGFGGFGGLASASQLLGSAEVRAELKVDAAQTELLQALQQSQRGQFQGQQGLSQEERQQRFAAARAAQEKQINEILNDAQEKRLKELVYQSSGPSAFTDAGVQTALKFTAAQKSQVTAITDAYRQAAMNAFGGNFQDLTPEQRQEAGQKAQAARTDRDAKLTAVLTATQKPEWEKMKGAAFTFPPPRRFGGNNN